MIATSVAAGLHGIRQGLDLDKVASEAAQRPLSRSLEQAVERLDRSSLARELLGDAFVQHFVQTRRWECDRFQRAVTDWGTGYRTSTIDLPLAPTWATVAALLLLCAVIQLRLTWRTLRHD